MWREVDTGFDGLTGQSLTTENIKQPVENHSPPPSHPPTAAAASDKYRRTPMVNQRHIHEMLQATHRMSQLSFHCVIYLRFTGARHIMYIHAQRMAHSMREECTAYATG